MAHTPAATPAPHDGDSPRCSDSSARVSSRIVVMAFVWPTATAQAQNLPVGISGPDEAVAAVEGVLAEQDPSPVALAAVDSRDDAVAADPDPHPLRRDPPRRPARGAHRDRREPRSRPGAPQLSRPQLQLTIDDTVARRAVRPADDDHPGASVRPSAPASAGAGRRAGGLRPSSVTDVVPLAAGDPTGAGIGASLFPLVLGGMLGGILLTLLVQGVVRRLVGLVVFGLAAGALIVLVMQTWFGILAGDWLLNAAVVATSVTATGAFIIGMAALIGPPGIGVAAVVTMLIANPIAAAAIPMQFLPAPWGAVGQWFVPGASANLLRSTSYFPDAPTAAQWLILGAWIVGGVVFALVGHRRNAAELTPAPASSNPSPPVPCRRVARREAGGHNGPSAS